MGFFGEPKRKTSKTPNNFDIGAAKYLHKHLAAKRLLAAPAKTKVWSEQIRLLRKDHSPQQISTVLRWYVKNLDREYVPTIRSARGFREKYLDIERAMRKGVDPRVIKIDDETERLVKQWGWYWPPGVEEDDVLYFVQASLTAYAEHIAALRRAALDPALGPIDHSLAERMWNLSHKVPVDLVEQWVAHVHRTVYTAVHRYGAWSGSLRNWVWRPTRKWYRRVFAEVEASQATGGPGAWDHLLELLNGY